MTWHSGSPKRTLYSSDLRPRRGVSMRPQYRTPAVLRAAARELGERRPDRALHHLVDDVVGHERAPACTRPCRRCSGPGRRRTRACGPARSRTVARRVPSQSTNTESSGPVMPSSITHVRPASPNASPDRYARTASRASAIDSVTITPLPAASPSVFTTYEPGERLEERERRRPPARRRTCRGARSAPGGREHVLHPGFEPSSAAAAARAPNARCPAASSASTTPATSGSSGPTTTRSGRARRRAPPPRPGRSPRPVRHSPSAAMPEVARARRTSVVDSRRAREPPRERVLATAASDDKDASAVIYAARGQHDGLVTRGADADEAHGHTERSPRRTARSRAPPAAAPRAGSAVLDLGTSNRGSVS